jgi:hypothetical protein
MVKTIRLMFQQLELKHQRLNNKHLHALKMSKDKMGRIKRNNQNLVQFLQRLILQFHLINNKRQEKVCYDLMRSKLGMHRGRQYYWLILVRLQEWQKSRFSLATITDSGFDACLIEPYENLLFISRWCYY